MKITNRLGLKYAKLTVKLSYDHYQGYKILNIFQQCSEDDIILKNNLDTEKFFLILLIQTEPNLDDTFPFEHQTEFRLVPNQL